MVASQPNTCQNIRYRHRVICCGKLIFNGRRAVCNAPKPAGGSFFLAACVRVLGQHLPCVAKGRPPCRAPRLAGGILLGDQMDLFSLLVGLVVGIMIGGTVATVAMVMVRGQGR
jgi:hypothetical protein